MSVKSRQAERSEATRGTLIATARRMFAEHGYTATATEDVVAAAGVTRGALYHHFRDKKDLFRAVFVAVEEELMGELAKVAADAPTAWAAVVAGVQAFLDACLDPEVQQIALVDAPSVLGWSEWRELDTTYGLGLVQAALEGAIAAGEMPAQPVEPLSHLLLGALNEAALMITRADDRAAARRTVGETVERLLESLRSQAATK